MRGATIASDALPYVGSKLCLPKLVHRIEVGYPIHPSTESGQTEKP
jgi:hypothetical protein